MRKIAVNNLDSLFAAVATEYKLYIPVDTDAGAKFSEWSEGAKLSDALNTVRSAKDFFFPQTENLVEFKMNGKNIEIIDPRSEYEDFAVFGVKACDVKSFEILDSVYLTDPVDSYYKARREHGLILSMTCARPSETCFCSAFGIDAASPAGDVVFTDTGKGYCIEAKTEKGEKFLESIAGVFTETDEKNCADAQAKTRAIVEKLPFGKIGTSAFGGGKTEALFSRPEWDELSEACLACGTCTFVCPTCQCYDIRDYDTGHGIKRFRCWDSCMYSDFTKMAHGNPRLTQKERFRQRFMHKLVYYPENNNGTFGCVGCGRCLASCPISMNIVKVMKKLEKEDGSHD